MIQHSRKQDVLIRSADATFLFGRVRKRCLAEGMAAQAYLKAPKPEGRTQLAFDHRRDPAVSTDQHDARQRQKRAGDKAWLGGLGQQPGAKCDAKQGR